MTEIPPIFHKQSVGESVHALAYSNDTKVEIGAVDYVTGGSDTARYAGDMVRVAASQTFKDKDGNVLGIIDLDGITVGGEIIGSNGVFNVKAYGATGDGTTDDTEALQAAIAAAVGAGGQVLVPMPAVAYRITDTLAMADHVEVVGVVGKPTLVMDSASTSRMFDFSGVTGASLRSLTIDGNKDTTPTGDCVYLNNATGCAVEDCVFVDLPGTNNGGIQVAGTSTKNKIRHNESTDAEGSFVGLLGSTVSDNEVVGNRVTDCGGFGIVVAGGSFDNLIAFNKTKSNGIELVGITHASHHNRLIGNHAEGCGDNGISLTGSYNTATGNVCYKNDLAGIKIWGSFNSVTGNECVSNNQVGGANTNAGIEVQANFGGVGQYNAITGNITDDDQSAVTQYSGVRLINNAYTQWANGGNAPANSYCFNGLNVYFTTTGGTNGSTAPTHTSGTVSDGGVEWEYIRSFISNANPAFNVVGPNVYGRNSSGVDYFDTNFWVRNKLIDDQPVSTTVSALGSAGIARKTKYVTDGAGNKRLVTSDGTNWRYQDGTIAATVDLEPITGAGALTLDRIGHALANSTGSSYAATLAAPTAAQVGRSKKICMVEGSDINSVTLALTNIVGGSAATTATFDAAGETLLLEAIQTGAGSFAWLVMNEYGVTLS